MVRRVLSRPAPSVVAGLGLASPESFQSLAEDLANRYGRKASRWIGELFSVEAKVNEGVSLPRDEVASRVEFFFIRRRQQLDHFFQTIRLERDPEYRGAYEPGSWVLSGSPGLVIRGIKSLAGEEVSISLTPVETPFHVTVLGRLCNAVGAEKARVRPHESEFKTIWWGYEDSSPGSDFVMGLHMRLEQAAEKSASA